MNSFFRFNDVAQLKTIDDPVEQVKLGLQAIDDVLDYFTEHHQNNVRAADVLQQIVFNVPQLEDYAARRVCGEHERGRLSHIEAPLFMRAVAIAATAVFGPHGTLMHRDYRGERAYMRMLDLKNIM